MWYVATLRLADNSTVRLTFRCRSNRTGTVTTHAREAAEREGYSDFTVEHVTPEVQQR